jgi:ABC-2 type transport system ATP-binding protein
LISVKHLTKRYGKHLAVSDLSFEIEKGQIYGFLGPNGAGKSTTMNIMTGCLAATSGTVTIGGYDIFEQPIEAKRLIGYLPEQPPLYMDRTPREYLSFVAQAKGIPAGQRQQKIQEAMTVTGILDVGDRLIKNLSKGYKQRVGIAQAILGDPDIIILDEPTVGLDPRQIIEIRELIRSLGEKHTVILSSHILSEVQAVCSTIMIISKGKLVACDTPENLEKLFIASIQVTLTLETQDQEAVTEALEQVSGITEISLEPLADGLLRLRLETDAQEEREFLRALFFAFSGVGIPILQMVTSKASLEDVFMELTAGDQKALQSSEPPKEVEPTVENPEEAASEEKEQPEETEAKEEQP